MKRFLFRVGRLSLVILLIIGLGVSATNAQTREEFRRQRQQEFQEHVRTRKQIIEQMIEERSQYYQERIEAFEKYRKQRARQWGKNNVRMPGRKQYVAYDGDGTRRHSVDFEGGQASVEVLTEPGQSREEIRKRLRQQIIDMVTDPGRDVIGDRVDDPADVVDDTDDDEDPLLKGQLQDSSGNTVTEDNAGDFADDVIDDADIEKESAETEEGKKIIAGVDISLVPNHLEKRVEQYQDILLEYARKNNLQPSLVFAIAHTESHFNPEARSHIPAYGLMQIVPETAGKDAYEFIHGEQRLLSADYLYDPENNVELGSAYLRKLSTVYLSPIENPGNRRYCTIASYNIGAGGMSRTFVNGTSVHDAADVINRLRPNQVYQKLREDLPAQETRDYMKKVTENQEYYRQWDQ